MAKAAFEAAIARLDTLPVRSFLAVLLGVRPRLLTPPTLWHHPVQEEQFQDATLIMQLIRDNLALWTTSQVSLGDA